MSRRFRQPILWVVMDFLSAIAMVLVFAAIILLMAR
jgi:hypothetical protein